MAPAPDPREHPLAPGTVLDLDERARFYGEDLVGGGHPWRLIRLPGASREALERWRNGGPVAPGEGALARVMVERGLVHPLLETAHDLSDLDVVIPVRGPSPGLEGLLASLDGLAVTVVDDGSARHELDALCAAHGAALYRRAPRAGPGAARDDGLGATTRPFVAFIDDDVSLPDPVEDLARLRGALADPRVGAVAPRVVGPDAPGPRAGFEHRHGALDLGTSAAIVDPTGAVPFVPSACLVARRDALGAGFDRDLSIGEDVDLVWRLVDEGWIVRYLPSVVVTHAVRPTWRAWWGQRRTYGLSSALLAERYPERLTPLRADRWTLAAWGSVLLGSPSLALGVLGRAYRRAREGALKDVDHPDRVAAEVVLVNVVRAGGPLARAGVRTFGIGLALCALHPALRRRALAVGALGVAWRLRGRATRPLDVPLAVLDDLAYGLGVLEGAWRHRSLVTLTPRALPSGPSWSEVLGLGVSRT